MPTHFFTLQRDVGIAKIRELEECLEDEPKFLEVLTELGDKTFWVSVTTKDLYYWINVLNKVDALFEGLIGTIQKLADHKQDPGTDQEKLYRDCCQKLGILLSFSTNLLRECNSRSIYCSVDVSIWLNWNRDSQTS